MGRKLHNTFFPRFERFNCRRANSLKTAVSDLSFTLLSSHTVKKRPQCALVKLWDWLFLKALTMYFCLQVGSMRFNFSYLVMVIRPSGVQSVRSAIIGVITKSNNRVAGDRFVNHEYDYRPNWTARSLITNESL